MILETPAKCGIKMKVVLNLLHRNGVVRNDFFISTISAMFERVEVSLHDLLISNLIFLKYKGISSRKFVKKFQKIISSEYNTD